MTNEHAGGTLTATGPTLIEDATAAEVVVYQFRSWLREISPMIWRRFLLRSDQTLADLHYTLQIGFGWTDFHLHRFALHGKEYGIPRIGGPWYNANARHVRLADLHLRYRERFVYEYDFGDSWVHEIRLEQTVALGERQTYPRCIGGARAGPPEDCGGPWAYLALRQHYSPFHIAERLVDLLDDRDRDDGPEELATLGYWLNCDRFDRRAVNRRLRLYAAGDDGWQVAKEEGPMKIRIQVVIEGEEGAPEVVEEVACVERDALQPETLGLTLTEAKDVLRGVQQVLVPRQVAEYVEQQRCCPDCGKARSRKGHHQLVIRSLFGRLRVSSSRYYTCRCQPRVTKSVSPLAELLPERTTPELQYLETKAAALESYERAVGWLEEVLPLEGQINTTALRRQMTAVAERLERELSDEEPLIEGSPLEWARLPDPAGPLTVGLDGGYVKARVGECPQATAFEVITGKSITAEGSVRRFAFVQGYDTKPRRRLFDLMRSQGMQMNQQVTFLSDGGDTVRELPLYLNPQAEHILDWFHVTMRLTVLGQLTESTRTPETADVVTELETTLERLKWYLWHGNVFRALQLVEDLEFDVDGLTESPKQRKLEKAVHEFASYVSANRAFIPNYGERYRYGETISTAFVESTVNQVISKRMVKKQQMRWTRPGAHNLLQIRTQVLDGEFRGAFGRWYPGMQPVEQEVAMAA